MYTSDILLAVHMLKKSVSFSASSAQAQMPLLTYLRNIAHLTGTKQLCFEGGCGFCVVSVSYPDPVSGDERVESVNSVSINFIN